jgi:hypothetical protein
VIPAHKQTEMVKRYLLGTLTDSDAALIEERSFLDQKVFEEIELAERILIEDYLSGQLTQEERSAFEARYLHIPTLLRKLEAVRQEPVLFQRSPIMATVVALALFVVLGLGAFWRIHNQNKAQVASSVPAQVPQTQLATVVLRLLPVLKKDASESLQLVLPAPGTQVLLMAELPGETQSNDFIDRLFYLVEDKKRQVWHGNTRSTPDTGGQQVAFVLDASMLQPGDYLLELAAKGGVQETYFFQVLEGRNKK